MKLSMWTVGFILVMVLAACGESSSRELEQRVATLEAQLATPVPHRAFLLAFDEDSIVYIQVSHGGRTVDYDRRPPGGTYDWVIQENGEETQVFVDTWSSMVSQLSRPPLRTVAFPFDSLASYGLEPPETVVKVTERRGLVEFHMGSTTCDSETRYIYLVGDPTIIMAVNQGWAQVITNLAKRPPYPPR